MISPQKKRLQKIKERLIEHILFACSLLSVLTTAGIIYVLLSESLGFFKEVSIVKFLTDTQWTPMFTDKHFGILPLLCGTFLTTLIAISVAVPLGLISAIYLSEYASAKARDIAKPLMEILAAVPTVVYGYFALLFVTPLLKIILPGISGFNALSAGLVMGVMIIPLVSSLSEDAMHAVPMALREGAYALGSHKIQVAFKIVFPAALSGITAAVILAVSRAIGETMIVAIAAGQQPRLTLNPLVPVETITAYIVQISLGDTPHGTIEYQTIFVCGMTLFLLTFALNVVSFQLRRRFQEVYD
ncbi:MAG: phosphate ABC transporter permease subunit PstC [Candidatus Omnitrophota bacterium]|nr:phosphate ABC transporter permease subunit PstC [Candidatus Omnitrophota bacterium]MDZ4243168.1 phosphate ABC transporter permease subunit PstC [Candidatus Omnitrophota bacterium]